MKHKLLLFTTALLMSIRCYAQTGQFINYQGVARDNAGNILENENISIRFGILSGISPEDTLYIETHDTVTDRFGLFALRIGEGTPTLGTFSTINWGAANLFLKVEINTGEGYQLAGINRFAATPYALHATTAETATNISGGAAGSVPYQTDTNTTAMLAKGTAGQALKMNSGASAPEWSSQMLTNFTESNYLYNTKYGVKLFARNDAQTDVDFVLSPKGFGGIIAQQPDGTAAGGNNRGINAVDLQLHRTFNTQVAGGYISVIVGGNSNSINNVSPAFQDGTGSVIVGGQGNNVSGSDASIVGGYYNTASGFRSFIGGGSANTASNWYSLVAGGEGNQATGARSVVGGGNMNSAVSSYSFVGGGIGNTAQSYGESVLGTYATVGTGNATSYVATDRMFVVGNGTADNARSNAVTILKNANTTIGGTLTLNGNGTGTSIAFPAVRGTSGQFLQTDGSGLLSWANLSSSGAIVNGGNSFAVPVTIGTNDSYGLNLETNNTARLSIGNTGSVALPAFTAAGILHNDASGTLSSSLVTNSDISSSAAIADSKLAAITTTGKVLNSATTATSANTANAIVARDASGNFTAGTITANLTGNISGNAANVTGIVAGTNGGTGIANTGKTITLGGNLTTSGAFATTLTTTATTAVTLPASGTLATLAGTETLTNKTLAAGSNTITGLTNTNLSGTAGITDANLATIATAGKVSNSATTATNANTAGTIVARDASGNFTAGTITANLTGNISGNAANVTGIVVGANGGTGIANTGKTITLGGNLTTSGAFATTLTTTATTAVTLPVSGTLATRAGTETLTNKTLAAGSNTITGLTNTNLSGTAGITDANLATIATAGKVSNSATTATNANTANAIVSRDASGNFTAGTVTAVLSGNATSATNIAGGAAGSVPYQTAAGTTNLLAKGTAGQVLTMNSGATAPQWSTPANGTVTAVTGTAPIVSSGGNTPVISISTATTSAAGSMSAADKTKLDGINGSETKVTAGTNVSVTGSGTSISPYIINATAHTIGESYGGGIVFWVDATGQHGLIAATTDQSTGIKWNFEGYQETFAIRDGIFSGMINTERIFEKHGYYLYGYAALICREYQGGGYGDWYLPSKYELNLLFLHKNEVGGFTGNDYWSSVETLGSANVWAQNFSTGTQSLINCYTENYVRAIRAF